MFELKVDNSTEWNLSQMHAGNDMTAIFAANYSLNDKIKL